MKLAPIPSMQRRADALFEFADNILWLTGCGYELYNTIEVVKGSRILAHKEGWSGGNRPWHYASAASEIGPAKCAELLVHPDTKFAFSPDRDVENSTGYKGAYREQFTKSGKNGSQLVVSSSAWSEDADLLFTLLLVHHWHYPVSLHHVGHGYATHKEMVAAKKLDERRYKVEAAYDRHDDHESYYIQVDAPWDTSSPVYIEHQYGLGPNVHWDFMSAKFLAGVITDPLTRLTGEKWSQRQGVWVDNNGMPMGVVTRDRGKS